MKTGRLIREARLRAGLTQRELAERAGTTQSSIARWETGGVRPSLETLASLVRACDLDLRVGLAEADDGDLSQIERTLSLSGGATGRAGADGPVHRDRARGPRERGPE